jgi:hypothetical protein
VMQIYHSHSYLYGIPNAVEGETMGALAEEYETNLMSPVIKFYFTSSVLDMFQTSVHPSPEACDFSVVSPHWLCVL